MGGDIIPQYVKDAIEEFGLAELALGGGWGRRHAARLTVARHELLEAIERAMGEYGNLAASVAAESGER